ncbi:MAG: hypothetical protein V1755_14070 [Chloroflexota bacterium]
MPTIKPGYRSTEFWMSIFAVALGAAMSSGLIPTEGPWPKIAGIVAAVLGALGYSVSRGLAKSGSQTFTVGTSEFALAELPVELVTQDKTTSSQTLPPGSVLLPVLLPLLLAAGLSGGCASWSRTDTSSAVKTTSSAACYIAALACEQWGGETCSTLVKLGCSWGTGALGRAMDGWAAADTVPAPEAIQATVIKAFRTEPDLVRYRLEVQASGVKLLDVDAAPRPIGFTTPGGANPAPVQPHD